MGTRRALLIGCNYPGTDNSLRGCVNDVHAMKTMLSTQFGFDPANMTILIDTDPSGPQPTGANIKAKLSDLVSQSADGDVLVMHFSGHGTQVKDKDGGEADGLDEAICPTDMNLLCDDDLRVLLKPLPLGCKFTFVSDCCHSGSMLDHPTQQISGEKNPNSSGIAKMDAGTLLGAFFKDLPGAAENKGPKTESKNRGLDENQFCRAFNSMHGTDIVPGMVRGMLQKKFGAEATKMLDKYLGAFMGGDDNSAGAAGGGDSKKSLVDKLLGMCLGSSSTATGGSGAPTGGAPADGIAREQMQGAIEPEFPGAQIAGTGTPAPKLDENKGILITGCQAHETSADACPSGDPNKAFGALTNALTTSVNAFKKDNPDGDYTYMQMVTDVREALLKCGFEQNPCLECSERNANLPVFV